jgi:hypothetical protein
VRAGPADVGRTRRAARLGSGALARGRSSRGARRSARAALARVRQQTCAAVAQERLAGGAGAKRPRRAGGAAAARTGARERASG